MRNMRISTAALAKICGVSQGTVDRALNGRAGISEKTKQKIIDTAIQYGYRPLPENASSKQIGVIVFNLNNEYLTDLVTEIEFALRGIGYTATVMLSHYSKEYEIECIKKLYGAGVDGIVLCSVNSGTEFTSFLSTLNIPIVSVGNKIDGIPFVGIDDFAAMKDLTDFVLSRGYRNVVYFSPALKYADAYAQKMRFEGFMEGVKGFKDYSVITELEQIEASLGENTAIICSTDYYALKVHFKGVSADIYGFDNIKMIESFGLPIISVDYSVKDIAENAITSLFNKNQEDVIIQHQI